MQPILTLNLATGLGSRVLRDALPHATIGTTNYFTPPIGSGQGPLAAVAERAADAVLTEPFSNLSSGSGTRGAKRRS
jgi:hypothetical protein